MASIQSLGIGSGLLTSDLVEDIIGAEREATDLRLDAQRAEVDARISSFASIRSTVDQLRSATATLSGNGGLISNTTTSSNADSVTATASTSASVGVHTVEVQSLARKATLASMRYEDIDSVVGDGTLDIRFGTTTLDGDDNYDTFTENEERAAVSIEIDNSNNTLAGVRDAINDANAGITASIVNDGDGYVLVLASDSAGADNSLEVTVTEGSTAGLSARCDLHRRGLRVGVERPPRLASSRRAAQRRPLPRLGRPPRDGLRCRGLVPLGITVEVV